MLIYPLGLWFFSVNWAGFGFVFITFDAVIFSLSVYFSTCSFAQFSKSLTTTIHMQMSRQKSIHWREEVGNTKNDDMLKKPTNVHVIEILRTLSGLLSDGF